MLGTGLAATIPLLVPAGYMASIVFAAWWLGSAIGSPKKKKKNLSAADVKAGNAVVKAGTEVKDGMRHASKVLGGCIFAGMFVIAAALFFK